MGRTRRLILVRHCEAAGQEPEAPLTETGERQAEALVEFLSGQPIDAVVSSEYRRARQTAEPLATARGLTMLTDPRLNERRLSEKPIAHWREIVRGSFADPDLRGPGGESAWEVLTRAWDALTELAENASGNTVVVSHGNLISLVLHSTDGTFGYEGWEGLSNPDVYLLDAGGGRGLRYRRIWK